MCEVIAVTSGKGGVGKSTVTAALGTGLAEKGFQVLLIDTDIGLRNLDVIMGLETKITYHIIDVLRGNCRIKQALLMDRKYSNLFIIPSSQQHNMDDLNTDKFNEMIQLLREEFDYILIDSPAGIENGFTNAILCADRIIVVTTTDIASIRDADHVIQLIRKTGKQEAASLIINKMIPEMVWSGDTISVEDVCEILEIELLGFIPFSKSTLLSYNNKHSFLEHKSFGAKAFQNICNRLTGEKTEELKIDKILTFWSKMNWKYNHS